MHATRPPCPASGHPLPSLLCSDRPYDRRYAYTCRAAVRPYLFGLLAVSGVPAVVVRGQPAAAAPTDGPLRPITRADAVALELTDDAEASARQLKHEAEDYVDQKLAAFEVVLERTMQAVEKGRERLQVVIEPEPEPEFASEELPGLAEGGEDYESSFFDQDAR